MHRSCVSFHINQHYVNKLGMWINLSRIILPVHACVHARTFPTNLSSPQKCKLNLYTKTWLTKTFSLFFKSSTSFLNFSFSSANADDFTDTSAFWNATNSNKQSAHGTNSNKQLSHVTNSKPQCLIIEIPWVFSIP